MNRAAMPTKPFILWIGIILLALLQACGGGGTRGRASGETPGATPAAESIQLLVSSQTIASAGIVAVDVTAVVLDANRRAVPEKIITLSVTDPNNTAFLAGLSDIEGKTNEQGVLTARLNVGTNHANRDLTLKAEADGSRATNTVAVEGTAVTISGATAVVQGASTNLTISVKDSAGNNLVGAPITLSSTLGNQLTPSSGTSNQNGQLIVTVAGTRSGADTITASALGSTASTTLAISGSDFAFVSPSPASDTDVVVNTSQQLKVRWFDQGSPKVGSVVTFNATRGTVTPGTAIVQADGTTPVVSITASSAGPTSVTATGPGGAPSTTLNFVFVTTTATSLNLQSDRSTVSVNAIGSDSNRATIRAVVRDAANNLVKNARVEFQLAQDPTAGRLATSSDITDVSGIATADYIAGTISSNQNGVIITARVADVSGTPISNVTASVNLTVGGQSLFIRLGTDNLVQKPEGSPVYKKLYAALVTDAAGNPQPNLRVQFEVNPVQPPLYAYRKGFYVFRQASWRITEIARCFNEDLNLNGLLEPLVSEDLDYDGVLDPGEDINGNGVIDSRAPNGTDIGNLGLGALVAEQGDVNGNGVIANVFDTNGAIVTLEDDNQNGVFDPAETLHTNGIVDTNEDFNGDGVLTPGNIASVNTNVSTDSLGVATAEIVYAREFANWASVTLQAKVIVAGTESVSRVSFPLPVESGDVEDAKILPPGFTSPFGVRRNCSSRF